MLRSSAIAEVFNKEGNYLKRECDISTSLKQIVMFGFGGIGKYEKAFKNLATKLLSIIMYLSIRLISLKLFESVTPTRHLFFIKLLSPWFLLSYL